MLCVEVVRVRRSGSQAVIPKLLSLEAGQACYFSTLQSSPCSLASPPVETTSIPTTIT